MTAVIYSYNGRINCIPSPVYLGNSVLKDGEIDIIETSKVVTDLIHKNYISIKNNQEFIRKPLVNDYLYEIIENKNVNKMYLRDGMIHRDDDKPARKYANGDRKYYTNGKLDRVNGPAIVMSSGCREWYQNGLLYRDGGLPSIVNDNGELMWIDEKNYPSGLFHRDGDKPTHIHSDGKMEWYFKGEFIKSNFTRAREWIN